MPEGAIERLAAAPRAVMRDGRQRNRGVELPGHQLQGEGGIVMRADEEPFDP